MKRIIVNRLAVLLALVAMVCFAGFASAVPGEQNGNSLSIVQPAGGAYVIVTELDTGVLHFKYGWNNAKQFESPALGYWIGVYDITDSNYVWATENMFPEPNPKMIKLVSMDTPIISGHEYYINFFVRDLYNALGQGVSNVTEVILLFTAP